MLILNVGGGKKIPPNYGSDTIINIDTMYYSSITPEEVEKQVLNGTTEAGQVLYCREDIWQFLERTVLKFHRIYIYRFLEHVSFTKVLYFIYLLSTVTRRNAQIHIIVPNYKLLAKMLLNEDVLNSDFEKNNILLTTELLNEPDCPHASIWTADRAKYFFELEGRFEVDSIDEQAEFDGRNIYLSFIAKRL